MVVYLGGVSISYISHEYGTYTCGILGESHLPGEGSNIAGSRTSDLVMMPKFGKAGAQFDYLFYVDESRLIAEPEDVVGLETATFPFARMALITPKGSQNSYLYHQVNSSHMSEAFYTASVNRWDSKLLPIGTS